MSHTSSTYLSKYRACGPFLSKPARCGDRIHTSPFTQSLNSWGHSLRNASNSLLRGSVMATLCGPSARVSGLEKASTSVVLPYQVPFAEWYSMKAQYAPRSSKFFGSLPQAHYTRPFPPIGAVGDFANECHSLPPFVLQKHCSSLNLPVLLTNFQTVPPAFGCLASCNAPASFGAASARTPCMPARKPTTQVRTHTGRRRRPGHSRSESRQDEAAMMKSPRPTKLDRAARHVQSGSDSLAMIGSRHVLV